MEVAQAGTPFLSPWLVRVVTSLGSGATIWRILALHVIACLRVRSLRARISRAVETASHVTSRPVGQTDGRTDGRDGTARHDGGGERPRGPSSIHHDDHRESEKERYRPRESTTTTSSSVVVCNVSLAFPWKEALLPAHMSSSFFSSSRNARSTVTRGDRGEIIFMKFLRQDH